MASSVHYKWSLYDPPAPDTIAGGLCSSRSCCLQVCVAIEHEKTHGGLVAGFFRMFGG